LLAAVLATATPGAARPLDRVSCKALDTERGELASKHGIEKAVVKGPEWTRAKMPPGTLEYVRRYLRVEEQLRFRCRGKKPPELNPEGASGESAESAPSSPKPAPKQKVRRSAVVLPPQPSRTQLTPRPTEAAALMAPTKEPVTTQSIGSSAAADAKKESKTGSEDNAEADELEDKGVGSSGEDAGDTVDMAAARADVPAPDRKPPRIVRRYRPPAKKTQKQPTGSLAEQALQQRLFPSVR
jgi:hypothetical protein